MKRITQAGRHTGRMTWLMPLLLGVWLSGCGGDGGREPILGIGNIAGNAPAVTSVVPANDAFNVATNNTVIAATFSEAVVPLDGTSFTIECYAPCMNPAGSVTLDVTNTIATYTLDNPLLPLTAYIVTITTAESLATGAAMVAPYEWHFTTGAAPDTIRPTVTATLPVTSLPGPTLDAPTNTAITAVFSKDMLASSITAPGRFTVTCVLPCISPDGTVTYVTGSKTASFTPDAELDATTTYTATIAATVTDTALNALAGNQLPAPPAASAYRWTFTTAAALAPAYISVLSTKPVGNAVDVCPTRAITATFTVPSGSRMSDASINSSTFTVTGPQPLSTPVAAASVVLDGNTGTIATFTPYDPLAEGVTYTVTIKGGNAGVKDRAIIVANEMLNDYTWQFTAGPPTGICLPPVKPGLIATFAIAATAGITNTLTMPMTVINGNVALDPLAECNAITVDAAGGFGLCGGATPLINGMVISPLYPDAGITSGAIKADLLAVFLSITPPAGPPAAGALGGATNLPAATTLGAISGSPLVAEDNLFYPGLYQSLTSILITGDITLDAQGDPEAVFIFQSSSTLDTAAGAMTPGAHTRILLVNGAKASNVWWQTGTSATLGTYTEFAGNILASESITMETGASSCGRLLAGAFAAGAFVFDANVISVPGNGCPE